MNYNTLLDSEDPLCNRSEADTGSGEVRKVKEGNILSLKEEFLNILVVNPLPVLKNH